MGVNTWIGSGNLTKAPEMRYTPEGKGVTSLRVAIDLGRKGDKENTMFVDVSVWNAKVGENGQADYCATYLRAGSRILIQGTLVGARPWKTKNEELRADIQIRAIHVEFLDRKEQ